MNTTFSSRIELFFWNFAIQALSNSRLVRSVIPQLLRPLMRPLLPSMHHLAPLSSVLSIGLLVSLSGALGLFAGLALYYVSALLR